MKTAPFSKNNLGGFNAISAMIASALENVSTCSLVQVVAVYPNPAGGLLAGTVDVQPMVSQIDDSGTPTPHGTICNLPYFQLQGGSSAVLLTPAQGDIGMAAFCDRDITSALANQAPSNPGSFRLFDKADGIYFGGVANGAPTQFIQMLPGAAGINVVTPGPFAITSETFTHNGVNVGHDHGHQEVEAGTEVSGPPVGGP